MAAAHGIDRRRLHRHRALRTRTFRRPRVVPDVVRRSAVPEYVSAVLTSDGDACRAMVWRLPAARVSLGDSTALLSRSRVGIRARHAIGGIAVGGHRGRCNLFRHVGIGVVGAGHRSGPRQPPSSAKIADAGLLRRRSAHRGADDAAARAAVDRRRDGAKKGSVVLPRRHRGSGGRLDQLAGGIRTDFDDRMLRARAAGIERMELV